MKLLVLADLQKELHAGRAAAPLREGLVCPVLRCRVSRVPARESRAARAVGIGAPSRVRASNARATRLHGALETHESAPAPCPSRTRARSGLAFPVLRVGIGPSPGRASCLAVGCDAERR